MPRGQGHYDVVVVGAGVTGLSTIYHLQELGVQSIALASNEASQQKASTSAAGMLTGGQIDNFTRIHQRHGADIARDVWRFGDTAFDRVKSFCELQGIPHGTGGRLRLITSEHELIEAKVAVQQLKAAAFPASLVVQPNCKELLGPCQTEILGIQYDGPKGGWLNSSLLLSRLKQLASSTSHLGPVRSIGMQGDVVVLNTESDGVITCEIVVLACHLGIRMLVPEIADVLVPVADQWMELTIPEGIPEGFQHQSFSANHANIWGVFLSDQKVEIGGAGFLRFLGGKGAEEAAIDPKVTNFLIHFLQQNLGFTSRSTFSSNHAGLDIRPCDELPLIGPMFGNGRVLIATGYMGAGLTLGFQAGACLSQLITDGVCNSLPRCFWPERHRTLEL